MYQILCNGQPTGWGGQCKGDETLAHEIQQSLRMMDKCGIGVGGDLFDRARHRPAEKLKKLNDWQENLKHKTSCSDQSSVK